MGIYPCGKPNRGVHVPHMHSPACSGNFHLTSTCCATAIGFVSQAIFSDTAVTRSVSQATTFLIRIPLRTPRPCEVYNNPGTYIPTSYIPASFFPDFLTSPSLTSNQQPGRVGLPRL